MENKEEIKKALSWIIHRQMETKSKLSLFSRLMNENRIYSREINRLLDTLSELNKLEEEIRKKRKTEPPEREATKHKKYGIKKRIIQAEKIFGREQ